MSRNRGPFSTATAFAMSSPASARRHRVDDIEAPPPSLHTMQPRITLPPTQADIIQDIQAKLKENAPPPDENFGEPWGSHIVKLLDRFHFESHNCLVNCFPMHSLLLSTCHCVIRGLVALNGAHACLLECWAKV